MHGGERQVADAGQGQGFEQTTTDPAAEGPGTSGLALSWELPSGRLALASLEEGLLSVGTHPDNSVVLDDPRVSRFHLRLHLRDDGRLWLRDLGSRNGTYVDGVRVAEVELQHGARIRAGRTTLRVERPGVEAPPLPGFSAKDPAIAPSLHLLRRAAPARLPVLLVGESGSGKEVAARALHELSPRAGGPFVPVNCGAIAAELAESELFGHERGSFTGAVTSSPGAFGAADGGTLFLDEIGELPLALQAKLLRALESDEVKPVGAPKPRRVDVRVVCATHRDLREMVAAGAFREDLFWRLRGAVVRLPPLRERPRDVLPLAEEFLAAAAEGAPVAFSADARAALLAHPWPGNVRELRQVVRLACALRDGPVVRAGDLRLDDLPLRAAPGPALLPPPPVAPPPPVPAGLSLAEVEAAAIRAAHLRHRGVRRAMVAELRIARSSLLRKLNALGLP